MIVIVMNLSSLVSVRLSVALAIYVYNEALKRFESTLQAYTGAFLDDPGSGGGVLVCVCVCVCVCTTCTV